MVVGVSGGTGAGKTTFVEQLCSHFAKETVTVLPQDAYYHDNSHIPIAERKEKNFDHPDAIEWELLAAHIALLQNGQYIHRPVYSMITCTRTKETVLTAPANILIVEGILIFSQPEIRDLCSLKIFLDAGPDARYQRILQRDKQERGRNDAQVAERFIHTVQPMHVQFIEPAKKYADIIVTGGGYNKQALMQVHKLISNKISLT
ncbi:MAG: uridine kinase [Chitinophagales bacterium]